MSEVFTSGFKAGADENHRNPPKRWATPPQIIKGGQTTGRLTVDYLFYNSLQKKPRTVEAF